MSKIRKYVIFFLLSFLVFTGLNYGKKYYNNMIYEKEIAAILNDRDFNHIDFYKNTYLKNFEKLVIEVVNLVEENEKNKNIIESISIYFERLTINKISMDKHILEDNVTQEDKKLLVIQNDLINLLIEKIELSKNSKN